MRDPKTGLVVEQLLAPAIYGPGQYESPSFNLHGFNSAAVIINLGAGPGPDEAPVTSDSFVFGAMFERDLSVGGSGFYAGCDDFQPGAFPLKLKSMDLGGGSYDYYQQNRIWVFRFAGVGMSGVGQRYRLSAHVKWGA